MINNSKMVECDKLFFSGEQVKAEIGSLEFLDGVIKRKQKKIANEMIERGCDAVSCFIPYVLFAFDLAISGDHILGYLGFRAEIIVKKREIFSLWWCHRSPLLKNSFNFPLSSFSMIILVSLTSWIISLELEDKTSSISIWLLR